MADSYGDGLPVRNIQQGHTHLDSVTGLIFRYLGGDPTDITNWIVDGGQATADPDTSGWGANQAGANWYNKTLSAKRNFDGSSIASVGGGGGSSAAIVSLGGSFLLPLYDYSLYANSASSNMATLNSSGDGAGLVFAAPKAGTLHKVWIRTATLTTGDTVRVAFEDLDANDEPDGTQDQYRDIVIDTAQTWYQSGILTDDGTDNGTPRTVTAGQKLSVTVRFESFVAGNFQIAGRSYTASSDEHGIYNTGAGWLTAGPRMNLVLEYDDGTIAELPFVPAADTVTVNVTNASDPDEYALKFSLPTSVRVRGLFGFCGGSSGTSLLLYDANDTELGSYQFNTSGNSNDETYRTGLLSEKVTLEADTVYRVAWKAGSSSESVKSLLFQDESHRQALGLGTQMSGSTRADGGAWTDSLTTIPMMGIIVDGLLAN